VTPCCLALDVQCIKPLVELGSVGDAGERITGGFFVQRLNLVFAFRRDPKCRERSTTAPPPCSCSTGADWTSTSRPGTSAVDFDGSRPFLCRFVGAAELTAEQFHRTGDHNLPLDAFGDRARFRIASAHQSDRGGIPALTHNPDGGDLGQVRHRFVPVQDVSFAIGERDAVPQMTGQGVVVALRKRSTAIAAATRRDGIGKQVGEVAWVVISS